MAEKHIIPFPENGKGSEPLTMSSREIAELTGKQHGHVIRDIEKMLPELTGSIFGPSDFLTSYKDSTGRNLKEYRLPKRETMILVSGYSVPLRSAIVDRWQELEEAVASPMQRALANHGASLPSVSAEQIDRMFGMMKQMNHRAAGEAREMAAIKSQVQALTEVVKPSVPGIFRPGKTPGAILKSEGFENCPPGVAAWFGNRLEAAGALISGKLDTGTAKSRLFDADLAHEWLRKGGRAAVSRHISEKKGQGALAIPGLSIRRTKKANAEGQGGLVIGDEVVTFQAGMTICPGEEGLLVMSQDGLHFGIGTRTMTGFDVTKTVRFGPPQGAMGMLPIFIVVGRVLERRPRH